MPLGLDIKTVVWSVMQLIIAGDRLSTRITQPNMLFHPVLKINPNVGTDTKATPYLEKRIT
jgi:hypothetical protein